MRTEQSAERARRQLLKRIKAKLPKLEALLAETADEWGAEDSVYRFYHGSFKVYLLQDTTARIVKALQAFIMPREPLCNWFLKIVADGAAKRFHTSHNKTWLLHTHPVLEAFFRAQYFLRMVCKYGREIDASSQMAPSGWAAVLTLYNLR